MQWNSNKSIVFLTFLLSQVHNNELSLNLTEQLHSNTPEFAKGAQIIPCLWTGCAASQMAVPSRSSSSPLERYRNQHLIVTCHVCATWNASRCPNCLLRHWPESVSIFHLPSSNIISPSLFVHVRSFRRIRCCF